MPELLRGNAVVAQSGGPTAVANASACGVIQETFRHDAIRDVLGANNGILGIVNEDLFDLRAETPEAIEALKTTPAAAIGSCRYKLGDLATDQAKYLHILDVFQAHDIRYFFYIGGNDSMDTAAKLDHLAREKGYELRVMGVPKTVDNDLTGTDHCPGFGSAAKFLATSVMEAGRDSESMATFDQVTLVETMGRNTGWLAAATGLARRDPDDAPHLIYVPEVAFDFERFLEDVRHVYRRLNRAFVVVSEGLVDRQGEYLMAPSGPFSADPFGHRQLGGVADVLQGMIEREIGIKAGYNRPGILQRNAIHCASLTDSEEAYRCGAEAVRRAVAGATGSMVTLIRATGDAYRCDTGLIPLIEVANRFRRLPREFLDEAGTGISDAFRRYAAPLIRGTVEVPMGVDGLPLFGRFQRRSVPRHRM